MAVEPEDVGALADAIVHGAEERLVADPTRALVDGLADGIIGGSRAEALEALARANRARLDQILAEHASKVSGEVRLRTLAALSAPTRATCRTWRRTTERRRSLGPWTARPRRGRRSPTKPPWASPRSWRGRTSPWPAPRSGCGTRSPATR